MWRSSLATRRSSCAFLFQKSMTSVFLSLTALATLAGRPGSTSSLGLVAAAAAGLPACAVVVEAFVAVALPSEAAAAEVAFAEAVASLAPLTAFPKPEPGAAAAGCVGVATGSVPGRRKTNHAAMKA